MVVLRVTVGVGKGVGSSVMGGSLVGMHLPAQFSPRMGGHSGSLARQTVPTGQGAILKPQGRGSTLGVSWGWASGRARAVLARRMTEKKRMVAG